MMKSQGTLDAGLKWHSSREEQNYVIDSEKTFLEKTGYTLDSV